MSDQAIRMGGYNQLCVIDRRSNILMGSYGISMGEIVARISLKGAQPLYRAIAARQVHSS